MNSPDPKKHLKISLIKSTLRIASAASIFVFPIAISIYLFAVGMIAAELLGIVEELQ